MTTEHNDDELEQLVRTHYHATVDGVRVPEDLLRQVLTTTEPQRGRTARWAPVFAFALAGASFLIILGSSRVVEVLFSF